MTDRTKFQQYRQTLVDTCEAVLQLHAKLSGKHLRTGIAKSVALVGTTSGSGWVPLDGESAEEPTRYRRWY